MFYNGKVAFLCCYIYNNGKTRKLKCNEVKKR